MNWDQVEGKWKQVKGSVKEKWGRFTDDDLEQIAGKRDKLVGMLQERYGMEREHAEHESEDWVRNTILEEHRSRTKVASR